MRPNYQLLNFCKGYLLAALLLRDIIFSHRLSRVSETVFLVKALTYGWQRYCQRCRGGSFGGAIGDLVKQETTSRKTTFSNLCTGIALDSGIAATFVGYAFLATKFDFDGVKEMPRGDSTANTRHSARESIIIGSSTVAPSKIALSIIFFFKNH